MESSNIFKDLKNILRNYSKELDCTSDNAEEYYLNTKYIMSNKKPLFFGAVKINKNYVSYHLMPVYINPSLLNNISDELKRRMQGKSCFNFKTIDDYMYKEISNLTEKGYKYYEGEGYVPGKI